MSKIFLEVIVAPSYSKAALNIFRKKTNLRIVQIKNIKKLVSSFKIFHYCQEDASTGCG